MQEILNKIDIPNKECIRGNITLPLEVDGVKISWKSSNESVISDKQIGKMAAGVVNRQAEDTHVVLSATIEKNGETFVKEFDVCVKKAYK